MAALPKLIDALRAEGLKLVTVDQLAGMTPMQAMPPTSRSSVELWIDRLGFGFFRYTDAILRTLFITAIVLGVARLFFGVPMRGSLSLFFFAASLCVICGIGLGMMIATFARKQDNPAIVLSYAVLEGLFLGAFSFLLTNFTVSSSSAGAMIGQAVLGTVGVFFGMLVVYKTGAIRVTPKFTRMAPVL